MEAERLRVELPTPRDVGATLHIHRAYTQGELKDTKSGRARSVAVIGPLADDLAAWRERTEWAEPADLVCPSLGRVDRPADVARQGGFLHLGNWRNRAFRPAAEWAWPPPSRRASRCSTSTSWNGPTASP